MNAAQFSRARQRIEREAKDRKGFGPKAMRKLIRESRAVTVIWGQRIVGWRMRDGSMVCKKDRYATREQAVAVMLGIQAEYGKQGKPRRAYQCEFCGGHHLTSKIPVSE
ncbi:hypothetical protein AWB77_06744 [Caballeronia fortuita]|uniref:Uncharacterized protein n=1 Tax=Caballeronia fortuita TaxID=1777138 RepID=A0A158E8N3_9BURK|nr:hypothetical protein [Caballeronia fortuita]SAL03229.1 hypothetical protein AWB77_06744 [Caballeronia fortuita]